MDIVDCEPLTDMKEKKSKSSKVVKEAKIGSQQEENEQNENMNNTNVAKSTELSSSRKGLDITSGMAKTIKQASLIPLKNKSSVDIGGAGMPSVKSVKPSLKLMQQFMGAGKLKLAIPKLKK